MGLLDLFLRPEDVPSTGVKPPVSPTSPPRQAPAPLAPSPVAAVTGDPTIEAKVLEKLQKAIEDSNQSGIDFFEFHRVVSAMTMIPDEATRFRAAYSSLVAQGATAENLIKTADFYVEVLNDKEASFAQYIDTQLKERVQGKLNAAEASKKQVLEKSEQIARLTQEIGKLTELEGAARNEAAQARAEIEAYQNTFKSVKSRLCSEIQGVKQKITTYVTNLPA